MFLRKGRCAFPSCRAISGVSERALRDNTLRMKEIELYSDGSCLGNPGPGGYGIVLRYPSGNYEKEFSEGFRITTNNRMELLGVITGLSQLKESCHVTITTDSQYVIKGVTAWIPGWIRNNWHTSAKKPVVNQDLWQLLVKELSRHDVTWNWIKGHNGHEYNERCDKLARTAAMDFPEGIDVGYEV